MKEAAAQRRSPDELAEDLLARHLLPQHPHVEQVASRSGTRAVVRGTRVGVDVIVGYMRAGYTPEEIASDVLPHLTLAQVYDALSYFYDHSDEIEEMLDVIRLMSGKNGLRSDQVTRRTYVWLAKQPMPEHAEKHRPGLAGFMHAAMAHCAGHSLGQ